MQHCPLRTLLHMQSCPLCKNRPVDMYLTVHLHVHVHVYMCTCMCARKRACMHTEPTCSMNIYIILDGFQGDTRIYCTRYDNLHSSSRKKAIQCYYYYVYQAEDLIKAALFWLTWFQIFKFNFIMGFFLFQCYWKSWMRHTMGNFTVPFYTCI